jgi:hypothetical protein
MGGIKMTYFPIETILNDLKDERAACIKALTEGKGDLMKAAYELAAIQGAIMAVEAQMSEDSPDERIEPESYPDD